MQKSIPEILSAVGRAATVEDKVAILKKHDDQGLRLVLAVAFDPNYEWDLPEGYPPLRRDDSIPTGYAQNNLRGQTKVFYIFEKKYTNVKRAKKEALFIDLLESLERTDADLMVAVKDGQLTEKYPGLDEALVRIAYPDLLTQPKSAAKEALDPR